ncbi:MAG: hypothetical protein ACKVZJ_12280 [Phycisphaerales bacterium]
MKKLFWIVTVALTFLSGLAVFMIIIMPRIRQTMSGNQVDQWVAQQVRRIANAYLVPEIQFDSFTYTHPGVLEMRGARLVAPDAAKTKVLEAATLRVTLAEVPSFGKPIVIERIDLDGAALRILRDPSTGGFKGLLPFVKGDNITDQNRVDAQVQLSTVLKIKKLAITNAELQYNDGTGPETMTLKGITLDMDVEPDSAAGPGWYALKLNVDRAPVFAVKGDLRLNVDTFEADLKPLTLAVNLNDEGYNALPPELQRPLREHDARGNINLTVDGRAKLRDPMNSDLKVAAALTTFNVAAGEYRLPIDDARADFTLSNGTAQFSRCDAQLLTGSLSVSGLNVGLSDASRPFSMSWNATNLELRELLRTKTSPGQPPKLAGKFNSTGEARGSLAAVTTSLSGRGGLTVRDGRLMNIPMLTELMESMDVLGQAAGANTLQDAADIDFDLTPQGVQVTKGQAETPVATAKFTGLIRYDLTLDLMANAGPLEEVQGLLGKVGGIIGEVTDKLVKYRITGPASDPKIEVKPLGF